MFTVRRLGIGATLAKTLTTTNCIESMISIARRTTGPRDPLERRLNEEALGGRGHTRGRTVLPTASAATRIWASSSTPFAAKPDRPLSHPKSTIRRQPERAVATAELQQRTGQRPPDGWGVFSDHSVTTNREEWMRNVMGDEVVRADHRACVGNPNLDQQFVPDPDRAVRRVRVKSPPAWKNHCHHNRVHQPEGGLLASAP